MNPKIETKKLNLFYGNFHSLMDISISIPAQSITAIIGPSGCGKSTLLRCFNRMNELIPEVKIEGQILLDGEDIHKPGTNLIRLRRRVGMVFQRPNPFPLSIAENITYGLRVHGTPEGQKPADIVEKSLRGTLLWDEVKDNLNGPALALSAEQQQRLCISRVLAIEPEILLMDEPCSALDPIATDHIEDLMRDLAQKYTIIIVTHNMQQASRVSSYSAFMLMGELIEFGRTSRIFKNPGDTRTESYISGRYG
ncbi:MAG: phosphate ABC transporter ATP-binding protein [Candidatus Hydrogenedens sp.]|jgi:phosphate transport system ATP-binding protein|nr:phosphate ABC transporter ATP-binding protein [Candidatus Hydrogenedens sp.]